MKAIIAFSVFLLIFTPVTFSVLDRGLVVNESAAALITPAMANGPDGDPIAPTGSNDSISMALENPLKFNTVEELFVGILSALMVIMMPIIVFFIIYAGFLYVTARGNAEQVQNATRALTYAVIGGVIVLGALAIAEIIKGIINPFVG